MIPELPPTMRAFRSELVAAIDRRAERARANRQRRVLAIAAVFLLTIGVATGVVIAAQDGHPRGVRTNQQPPESTTTTIPPDPIVPTPLPPEAMPQWREITVPNPAASPTVAGTADGFTVMAGSPGEIRAWKGTSAAWREQAVRVPVTDDQPSGYTEILGYRDGLYYVVSSRSRTDPPTFLVGPELDQLEPLALDMTPSPPGGHLAITRVVQQFDAATYGVIIHAYELVDFDITALVPREFFVNPVPGQQLAFADGEIRLIDNNFNVAWSARLDDLLTPEEQTFLERRPRMSDRHFIWVSHDGRRFTQVTLPVDLTQVSSSSVTDDGFEVTDVSNADPAGAMRTVWWSSDGSTWQKRADLPAPIAPANRHFTGRVQANAWIPVEGSATGLSLDDIDLALGVKEDGGQCATVSSACNRTVLRAESRSGTLVLSRGRDARNHVYWSPDGRAWATAPLDEVTSLGSEWMVESVHADDAGSFLIVASKSTARGLDRTLEVRMFHATVA